MAKTSLTDVIRLKSEHAQKRYEQSRRPRDILDESNPYGGLDTLVDPLGSVESSPLPQGPRAFGHLGGGANPGAFLRGQTELGPDFRSRMSGEMTSLRQEMETQDGLDLDKRDEGRVYDLSERFLDGRREGLDEELEALQTSKPVTTGTTKSNRWLRHLNPQTGSFVESRNDKGRRTKISTLSGGRGLSRNGKVVTTLEDRLQNPDTSQDRPRVGMSQRHKEVYMAATESDRLMNTLDTTGELPTDYLRKDDMPQQHWKKRYINDSKGVPRLETRQNNHSPWSRTRLVGMNEFKNRPTRSGLFGGGEVERSLQQLKPHGKGGNWLQQNAYKNRLNVWGESDLDYVSSGGFNNYTGRTGSRLHYTSPNSRDNNTNQKVDFNYAVSTDHYESAIPITPVDTNYKGKKGYTGWTGKKSSLQVQDELNQLNDPDRHLEQLHQDRIDEREKETRELGDRDHVGGVVEQDNQKFRMRGFLSGRRHGRMDEVNDLALGVEVPDRVKDWEERSTAPEPELETPERTDRLLERDRIGKNVDLQTLSEGLQARIDNPPSGSSKTPEREQRDLEKTRQTSNVSVGLRALGWEQRLHR